jgi:hypothetical protein
MCVDTLHKGDNDDDNNNNNNVVIIIFNLTEEHSMSKKLNEKNTR